MGRLAALARRIGIHQAGGYAGVVTTLGIAPVITRFVRQGRPELYGALPETEN
jgi:hypothetical protein